MSHKKRNSLDSQLAAHKQQQAYFHQMAPAPGSQYGSNG